MKKLLQNIKHLIILLLLTISLNAFAAQHKEIKHNIQAKNDYNKKLLKLLIEEKDFFKKYLENLKKEKK